jgi:IS605 OrfB family transposase
MSATVKLDGGRWYVSFSVEIDRQVGAPARPDAVLGVDVGIKHLAVLSTGETVDNPRHLAAAFRHLRRTTRRLSRRRGPDRRTNQKPSKRWLRAKAELTKAHARVAHLRRDGLHKLTTGLAAEYGTIVVEDLNVAGMVRNRKLAKAISDCGFGTIRTMLGYKTTWNGGRLVTADRWFPSSKTCSGCGAVTGAGVAVHPEPHGSNGRGADRKTRLGGPVAVKRLPGTAPAGQTETVPPQGGTTNRVITRAH